MKALSLTRASDGKVFDIAQSGEEWKISSHEQWCVTDAVEADFPFGGTFVFDSRIKAYAWLKQNIDELL